MLLLKRVTKQLFLCSSTASGQLFQLDCQKRSVLNFIDFNDDGACGSVTEIRSSPLGNVLALGFADGWLRYLFL